MIEISTGLCPVCHRDVALSPRGTFIRHSGRTMRWSGRRWFRTTCRGSGRKGQA